MIKPLTLVTGLAMAAAIGHTFEVKRAVAALDRELRDIRRGTEDVEARTQLLQAEWARLNDQDRLRALADRHLAGMVPMQPTQFQRLDEAARRLPVAVAYAGPASPFAPREESAPVALAEVRTTPAATAAAAPPIPAATQLAAARPAQSAPAATTSGAPPGPQRPAQMAEATTPRPSVPASPRAVPVLPEAAIRTPAAPSPGQSLPPVAAPPSPRPSLAAPAAHAAASAQAAMPAQSFSNPTLAAPRAAPLPAAPSPAALAEARRPAPAPRMADSAALPPVAGAIRPAMLVQRVDTGSLLGGQATAMAPPVPYGR